MVQLFKRSGILIPREYENESFYKMIKTDLTRHVKDYGTSVFTEYKFYIESEKFLLIPRNYPIDKYLHNYHLINKQHKGKQIEITHNIVPRSDSQKRAISHMLNTQSCILQLPPGVGKTVISIFVIAELKVKSIILVHRDSLVEQWRDRFLAFTNLPQEQISRLGSSTFAEDLQKSIILSTTQTFLSILKRNRREFLQELNNADIGLFIGDEVHTTVGAPTFSECSIHLPCYRTYGLSATPYRYDGNGDIIEYHLGSVYVDKNIEGTLDAKVTMILLDYQIDVPKRFRYLYWGGDFQRARYLNMLKKSEPFLQVIKALLMKFKDDRHMLVMLERVNLINMLFTWLPADSKSCFYRSNTMKELDYKVTFTTPGKCRDGVDAPWKDCIIMTSPIANIEQLTGRVLRSYPGKKQPIIVDLVDIGCKRIAVTSINRIDFYENKGWDIQYVIINDDGTKRQLNKSEALEIIKRRD